MAMDDYQPPPFFIGHHDHQRSLPVTYPAIEDAHAANVSVQLLSICILLIVDAV